MASRFSQTQPVSNDHNYVCFGHQLFSAGHSESIGVRPSMEDASAAIGEFAGPGTQYYGVFDGHGGSEVATYLANNLHRIISRNFSNTANMEQSMKDAFSEIDKFASSKWKQTGSTVAIVAIVKEIIYIANCGDARVVLDDGTKGIRLSYDHKPNDPSERQRISDLGGFVAMGRVGGVLAVSRAIGDGAYKPYVSNEPYISHTRRKPNTNLIIACDGIWDVIDDNAAAAIVRRYSNTAEAARVLRDEALKRGTTDNVTCFVISMTPK